MVTSFWPLTFDAVTLMSSKPWMVPSLKLTNRPWKLMLGILVFPFGMVYFQELLLLVSGRVRDSQTSQQLGPPDELPSSGRSGSAVGLQHMWNRSGENSRELWGMDMCGSEIMLRLSRYMILYTAYKITRFSHIVINIEYRYIYRYCTWKRKYTCDSYCHRLGGRRQHSNVWATFSQVLGTTYLDSLVDLWTKMSSLLVVLFDIMCVLFYIHLCIRSVYIYIIYVVDFNHLFKPLYLLLLVPLAKQWWIGKKRPLVVCWVFVGGWNKTYPSYIGIIS